MLRMMACLAALGPREVAAAAMEVAPWRPPEAGRTVLCTDPTCSARGHEEVVPKTLSPGAHIFEIRSGPSTPPQVFGLEPNPRPYLVYVPSGYVPGKPIQLWVHAPGSAVKMETVFAHNQKFAEANSIAMVFLNGLSYKMNVVYQAHSHADGYPDDVAYTQVCLQRVFEKINVDKRRVYCVGFSRGARFCSRLASELSVYFAGIAGVAGIRYPIPNNATKPVPVMAVHGVHDWINPYLGGGPDYWGEGMPITMERWRTFNGCGEFINDTRYEGINLLTYQNCTHGATVLLYKLLDRGHDWPRGLPVNIRMQIKEFFDNHTEMVACHTVHEEDTVYRECFKHMRWVQQVGLFEQGFLYQGLTPQSSDAEVQELLHLRVYANCPMPCPAHNWSLTADEKRTLTVRHARLVASGDRGGEHELLEDKGPKVVFLWIAVVVLVYLAASLSVVAVVQIRRARSARWESKSFATERAGSAKQLFLDLTGQASSPQTRSVSVYSPRGEEASESQSPARFADAL